MGPHHLHHPNTPPHFTAPPHKPHGTPRSQVYPKGFVRVKDDMKDAAGPVLETMDAELAKLQLKR